MKDIFVGIIIVIVLALSAAYILKEKQKGTKCIGCPHAKSCPSHNCCSENDIDKK